MNRWLFVVYLTTCLLTGLAPLAFAQTTTTLTGTVADVTTGKGMPFANVYVNGSTRGTLTNEQGHYSLTRVPLGTVEIVASSVGYQPQSRTIRLEANQNSKAQFRLKPSEQTLLTVTVHGNPKKWERHLKQFKRQLLGEPFGSQCLILNNDVLSFKEEGGHLKATASEPILIDNQALGYQLRYELLSFDGSFKKVFYAGNVHFDEIKPVDERQAKRFRRNRLMAYKGSTRHLMASLVDGSYEREGFLVYQENRDVLPLKTSTNHIILAGSIATDTTKGHLQPLKLSKLVLPGRLSFERRLLSEKTLIVFNTNAASVYSPYTDARYAYSEINLPTGEIQLTTDGAITLPNGMVVSGSLSDDRLSTLLPNDWKPLQTEAEPPKTNGLMVAQGRFLLPDARQKRIASAFTDRFQTSAPILFVHTDKPFYATGDLMWLSAYLLDAATNRRPLGETAIHADVLTPTGKLVQHQWLRVLDGRATGSFRFSDSLASGTYRLRAYTDEDDGQRQPAFERTIAVFNLFQSTPPKFTNRDPNPLDVQVLPEGGHWVVGQPARLGIKMTDLEGHGVLAPGVVVTNEGTTVCHLNVNALGMGSFSMTPEAGKKYYADVVYNNQHQLVPLPQTEVEGLSLSADAVSDTNLLALTITGTNRPWIDSVYVLFQQQGRLVDQRKILLQNGLARLSLPTEPFLPGLLQITLYDAAARPQAERLVFISEQLSPVRVLVDLNKARYQPGEQAILSINLNDEGLPALAALSASITDAGQVSDDTAAATIRTHLLLTGELRGRVEQPNFYVKDNALETRRAVDDLLLTQGWRRVSGMPAIALTGGISLMGRVLNAKNQPLSGAQVIVASTGAERSFVRSAETDDKGRFRLAGLEVADTLQLMTQLADHQLKNFTEKEAHLVLEGPWTSWQPDTTALSPNWAALPTQVQAARTRQENDNDLYRDKMVKQLKAVTVRAKKLAGRPDDIQRSSLHSEADATLVFDETSPRFANLYEMLRGNVSGVRVSQIRDPTKATNGGYQVIIGGIGTLKSSSQPLYVIDGKTIQDNDGTALLSFNPGDVERIEVQKNSGTAGIYGVRGGNGVIAFYTKRFRLDRQKSAAKGGSKSLQLIGYASVQREFYLPKYTAKTQLTDRLDRRDVLYWKPLMQTDSQGHSQLIFPLSDVVRTIRVTLQGITETGRPIAVTKLIHVQ